MVEREQAGEILGEIVTMARVFRNAGKRRRERTIVGTKIGILRHLTFHDARLGELAESMSVSASVASRVVDSLEADGMVKRRTDNEDARAFLISITQSGRENLAERERYVADVFADVIHEWTPQEINQALDILQRLNGHLSEFVDVLETNERSVTNA